MKVAMDDRKSSTWCRDICRICDVRNDHNWFEGRIRWKLGNGRRIRFWEDKWVGNLQLKQKFPRLHFLSPNKESAVCEEGKWVIVSNKVDIRKSLNWRR